MDLLDKFGFIPTKFNSVDPLSKDVVNETLLLGLLRDGRLEINVAELIIENTSLPDVVNAPSCGK